MEKDAHSAHSCGSVRNTFRKSLGVVAALAQPGQDLKSRGSERQIYRRINDLEPWSSQRGAHNRRTWHMGAGGRWFESSRPDHFSGSKVTYRSPANLPISEQLAGHNRRRRTAPVRRFAKFKPHQLKRRGNSGVTAPTPSHASIRDLRSAAHVGSQASSRLAARSPSGIVPRMQKR
jgi:hypothetical protein